MRFTSSFIVVLLITIAIPVAAQTQPDSVTVPKDTLRIGVAPMPPFIIKTDNNLWDGISVQMWREVADELNLVYAFREVSADSLITYVADSTLDMALLANVTSDNEAQVDFSHIYYSTTLGVAGSYTQSIGSIAKSLLTQRFLKIILWLSLLLLIVGTLVWLAERRTNENHFGGERNFWQGIGSGFWWAGVTMTTIGYGDKAPVTFWGRALALLWMLIAMAVTASLTAALVSVVGVGQGGTIQVPNDLRKMKVGAQPETDAATYLQEVRINFQPYDSVPLGLEAVQEERIEAFVHSAPVLRYWVNENSNLTVRIETSDVRPQRYAIAMATNSPWQEPIDQALLKAINAAGWQDILNRYVPE